MCTASDFTFREIYVGVTPSTPIYSKLHTVYTHGIFTLREIHRQVTLSNFTYCEIHTTVTGTHFTFCEIHTTVTRIGNGRRKMHTRVTAKEGSRYVKSRRPLIAQKAKAPEQSQAAGAPRSGVALTGTADLQKKRRGGLPDPGMKKPREGFAGLVVF